MAQIESLGAAIVFAVCSPRKSRAYNVADEGEASFRCWQHISDGSTWMVSSMYST
jgi:hypothetical protein